jgi:hypothetical protein
METTIRAPLTGLEKKTVRSFPELIMAVMK